MKRQVHPAATLIAIALLSAAVGHGSLAAQAPQPRLPHAGLPPLNTVSIPQYRAHLHQLQTVVEDCARSAAACDPKRVGPTDDLVHFSGGRDLIERYGWLRDVLHDRNDPLSLRRPSLLPHAMERLRQQEEELDKPLALEPLTRRATSARDHVLARSEFRTNSDYSLSDRLEAWFSEEMGKLFGGFSSLGRMAPWLGTALQWGVLLLAASLLAAWVYRALDRQRIALGRLHGNNVKEAQQAESRAWAERGSHSRRRGQLARGCACPLLGVHRCPGGPPHASPQRNAHPT